MNTDGLNEIADSVREYLDAKHRARERVLPLTRDVIRLSANAIRAVHRAEFDKAEELIAKGRANLVEASESLVDHQDVFNAGFVHDAQKEFAEANCSLALIAGRPLPTPKSLGIMEASYMNGLAEAIGELRRHLLDSLRAGDIDHCEETLQAMGDIYDVLVTMDYPEAVTLGLRRNTDAMRGILERTRGDFTMAANQRKLETKIRDLESRLPD